MTAQANKRYRDRIKQEQAAAAEVPAGGAAPGAGDNS